MADIVAECSYRIDIAAYQVPPLAVFEGGYGVQPVSEPFQTAEFGAGFELPNATVFDTNFDGSATLPELSPTSGILRSPLANDTPFAFMGYVWGLTSTATDIQLWKAQLTVLPGFGSYAVAWILHATFDLSAYKTDPTDTCNLVDFGPITGQGYPASIVVTPSAFVPSSDPAPTVIFELSGAVTTLPGGTSTLQGISQGLSTWYEGGLQYWALRPSSDMFNMLDQIGSTTTIAFDGFPNLDTFPWAYINAYTGGFWFSGDNGGLQIPDNQLAIFAPLNPARYSLWNIVAQDFDATGMSIGAIDDQNIVYGTTSAGIAWRTYPYSGNTVPPAPPPPPANRGPPPNNAGGSAPIGPPPAPSGNASFLALRMPCYNPCAPLTFNSWDPNL